MGGQEIRQPSGDPHTILAVATGASSAANVKEAVATRLLQYVLGLGSNVKRGGCHGKLSNAVSNISSLPSVSALNYSYSDAGLLGAIIACESQVAGQALENVIAALRSINVTECELAAAKKPSKLTLKMHPPQ